MKIIAGWRSDPDRPLTDPLPEKKWSVVLRFIGGDWLDPIGVGTNWFSPPFPKRILHLWWPLWLSYVLFAATSALLLASILAAPLLSWAWAASWPVTILIWLMTPGKFIAWRCDQKGGYAGSKIYGVDAPVYGLWLCDPAEVFDGSLAMCLTIRPMATIKD